MFNLEKLEERRPLIYLLAPICSFLIIFSRRPDALLNPQFWAEDGKLWYAEAYNQGVVYSLTAPVSGYFQTISRLVAGFSQLFPFEAAPLIFNLSAIAVVILTVQFILSKRLVNLLPAFWMQLAAAFFYLAVPHSYETHANLTNAQWHLALLGCLIVLARPPATVWWKVFDVAALAIFALSGPFCLMLLPVALVKYRREKDGWTLTLLPILGAGCLLQGVSLMIAERPSRVPLGAGINLFLRILGGHLFVGSIFGQHGYDWTFYRPFWKDGVAIIINLLGLGLVVYVLIKTRFELRLLLVFAIMIAAGAFISPAISNGLPQWEVMRFPAMGSRYWLIPIFAFFLSLLWLAAEGRNKFLRRSAAVLLMLTPIGIVNDWRHLPYRDLEFPKYAAEFEAAVPGDEVTIPINPEWEMSLKKK